MLQRVGGKGEGPEAKAAAREAVVITESPLRMHTARTSGGDGALFSVSVPGEVRGVEMADRAFVQPSQVRGVNRTGAQQSNALGYYSKAGTRGRRKEPAPVVLTSNPLVNIDDSD